MIVKRSIVEDFPGDGVDTGPLHQEAMTIGGFLAINVRGDIVEFLFDDTWDGSQEAALAVVISNHNHPAMDPASILQFIQG